MSRQGGCFVEQALGQTAGREGGTLTDPEGVVAVRGRLVLPAGTGPVQACVVSIRVEEVSRADAAAAVIAEQQHGHVEIEPGGEVAFSIAVPGRVVDRSARYSVRAHIDVAGTGEVSEGDFVSTRSHPVLTGVASADEVIVPVQRV